MTSQPDYWPSAKVTVHEDEVRFGVHRVTATLYAPGLPPGEYDLYLPTGDARATQESRPEVISAAERVLADCRSTECEGQFRDDLMTLSRYALASGIKAEVVSQWNRRSNERKDFAQSSAFAWISPQGAQAIKEGNDWDVYPQRPGREYIPLYTAPPDKGSVSAISTTAESLKADRV